MDQQAPVSEADLQYSSTAPQEVGQDIPLESEVQSTNAQTTQITFQQMLTKDGPFGLTLDVKYKGLAIVALGVGRFNVQNSKAEPSCRAQLHDYVVRVNEHTDREAMLREIKDTHGPLSMTFVRTTQFTATFIKGQQSLGLGLSYQAESISVDIRELRVGCIMDYNATAPEGAKINCGDSFVAVNGCSGDCKAMIHAMRTQEELFVTLRRGLQI